VSLRVHASPSLHAVPSALGLPTEHWPVDGLQTPARWQESLGSQVTGCPGRHAPAWQVLPVMQRLPPLHDVPSGLAPPPEHCPVAGSQTPAAWQASPAAQTTGVPGWQLPFMHASPVVHALPSLHAVPFGFVTLEHWPVVGSQTPASWQASPAAQTTGAPGWQAPFMHASPVVHALPSLHAVPFGLVAFEHWPVAGSQTPASWQASPAAHTTGAPAVQAPA
jgi:hypothetical protein